MIVDDELKEIQSKIIQRRRINKQEAIFLFNAPLSILSELASLKNKELHDNKVFFIRNIHIEPTNICKNKCKFCSFSKMEQENGAYSLSFEDIIEKIEKACDILEVHIVGGVNPKYDLNFYKNLFSTISKKFPKLYIKGLTAEEIVFLSEHSGLTIEKTLEELKESGLKSMPGGGAEIFEPNVRKKICPEKITAEQWLNVHQTAHNKGLKTNATMLYGHIETINDRIEHLEQIRNLQDQTFGFNAFIPLKYKISNNSLNIEKETPLIDDLKVFAISRLFLDNIRHIKAYWPNIGFDNALLTLDFGVNDMDGTISQSTAIYENTGNIKSGGISASKLIKSFQKVGKIPVERDSDYNFIQSFVCN